MVSYLTAHSILELPAGTAEKSGTVPGDQLSFETPMPEKPPLGAGREGLIPAGHGVYH